MNRACGNVEIVLRFPRGVGSVGILVLDFHAFHPPSFPWASLFPQPPRQPAVKLGLERIHPADHQRAVQYLVIAIVVSAQA